MEKRTNNGKGQPPQYKSPDGGWSCWINLDRNSKKYLTISIAGIGKNNLFRYTPKKQEISSNEL